MNRISNSITIIAFSAVLSLQTSAHSDTAMTIPAHGAVLEKAPATVFIRMTNKIRLTKVEMRHEEREAINIDLSQYKKFEKEFTLPVEPMGGGIYSIYWRALGQDGHPIQGELKFTVTE